jgi:SMC interacting uncharacterized protein involved in chromosome segregation
MPPTSQATGSITIPIVEFMDREIGHLKEKMELRVIAQEQAVTLAMVRLNERLAEMNQLREQITNERGVYLTRERFDHEHATLQSRVSAIELLLSNYQGRMAIIFALGSLAIVAINHFWK